MTTVLLRTAAAVLIAGAVSSCSIRRLAINKIGDALASGGSTYESDDDIELVEAALPFGLKLIESLLAEAPRHRGLLLAACEGFTTYAYLCVQQKADLADDEDFGQATALRGRARRLLLRAHGYGTRGLEAGYPGLGSKMMSEPKLALAPVRKKDVPLLYWNAAALGLAISVSRHDAAMLARLPEVDAMIERALELDPDWKDGSLHEFRVTFSDVRPGKPDFGRVKKYYDRALELSGGKRAGLFVAYAEAVSLRQQNRNQFRALLEKALAIDVDHTTQNRIANIAAQRRARRLLERADELILETEAITAKEVR